MLLPPLPHPARSYACVIFLVAFTPQPERWYCPFSIVCSGSHPNLNGSHPHALWAGRWTANSSHWLSCQAREAVQVVEKSMVRVVGGRQAKVAAHTLTTLFPRLLVCISTDPNMCFLLIRCDASKNHSASHDVPFLRVVHVEYLHGL